MSRNFTTNKNFDIFKSQKKGKSRKSNRKTSENEVLFNEIFNTYETQTRMIREKSYEDRNPLVF